MFRIASQGAPDRVISTLDPDARHSHKTVSSGFDGDRGHAAVDPDSEIPPPSYPATSAIPP